MKINQIIIFALLIVFVYSIDCGRETSDPSKPSDCAQLSDTQIKEKNTKCCLIKYDDIATIAYSDGDYRTNGKPFCQAFREKTLKNLKTFIKYKEVKIGIENLEIDCNSSYIKLSLICLLLFFI